MKIYFYFLTILLISTSTYGQNPVYELIWADEFEGNGVINSDNWFHQTLLPNGNSWYNGEIQHYTNREENSFVSDGTLKIVAKKGFFTDQGVIKEYTSARLNSKFAFTYGKVEVRAKLPFGIGTWPAIWTLGQNITEPGGYWNDTNGTTSWPACGELDIMEHWGNNQDFIQSAIHSPSSFGNTFNKGGRSIPNVSNEFHIYTMEWTAEKMIFSVDNIVHYTYEPAVQNAETWPFDANQYILLNVAIQPDIDPSFTESSMEIDFVRVYQEEILTIDNNPLNGITIYPNPAKDILHIEAPADYLGSEITIHSMIGQTVFLKKIDVVKFDLNVSELEKGTYFIRLINESNSHSQLFIKQ